MEIGEIISPAICHTEEEKECPFCTTPKEEKKDYKTYAGADKDENRLKDIMADPSVLSSKDSGAREKNGNPNQQQRSTPKIPPVPPLSHDVYGIYTYEAHHLIPGKEKVEPGKPVTVMAGHPIEKWIKKGDKIDRDTGYSINNSDNGVWLPSATVLHKKNKSNQNPDIGWNSAAKAKKNPDKSLTQDQKTEIAYYAMNCNAGQFHYGQHKILDDEGIHYTYTKKVRNRLTDLESFIRAWSEECLIDGKTKPTKPPYTPTWKINEKLDLISIWIEIEIRLMPPSTWTYFLSSFAKNLAKELRPPTARSG
ncbi:MAG: AHH domain-containing protein [Gammaproteobacteria bacterium]|nr:AHH domain-containing protein [Gammaproteobacteria bacterium]